MNLGEKIRRLRTNDKMSQQQLAEILSVSRQAITKWESNRGIPDIDNLAALSDVFYTSVDEMIQSQDTSGYWKPCTRSTYIHIVMGDSFSGTMKQALKKLGLAETQKIITLRENYSIGPIGNLDTSQGRETRSLWFRENITEAFEDYTRFEEEYQELLHQIDLIPKSAKVIIWTGSNALEQIGLRHAAHLIRSKGNSLNLCDACAIHQNSYNKIIDSFYNFCYSGIISVDELCEILKSMDNRCDTLNPNDILRIENQWLKLSKADGILRIWQNGEILNVKANYYDDCLLKKLEELEPSSDDNGFIKSARLIGEMIGHCHQFIGDSYFEYRLREMIYAGFLEIKGVPSAMRYYSIRRKQEKEKI